MSDFNTKRSPDLFQSLQGRDLGHLQIVAAAWGVEFSAVDARSGLEKLVPLLLDQNLLQIVLQDLSPESRNAFFDLARNRGRLPWARFCRLYGVLREMGPARRDRELPHINPTSATEELWYHGLIGRGFFDAQVGLQEYTYIPSDILVLVPESAPEALPSYGRIALSVEKGQIILANDQIIDHACTLLGALRSGQFLEAAFNIGQTSWISLKAYLSFLQQLLTCVEILDSTGFPDPEATRKFLEMDRGEAQVFLVKAWLEGNKINDFRMTPGLVFEGVWENDVLHTRQFILDAMINSPGQIELLTLFQDVDLEAEISPGINQYFVGLEAFINSVKLYYPDFQRPAGDYDSWFIKSEASGEYLRGFQHWNGVDGLFINYIICGPMHWLGLTDLTTPQVSRINEISAFRFSRYAPRLLKGEPPITTHVEENQWVARSDGLVKVPRISSRTARYQIARFASIESFKEDVYLYRITPASLERARRQGLSVSQLLGILKRQTRVLPPSLVSALERWESQGASAMIERAVILRVRTPDILQALRTSRAARFLGEPLGPTTIIIKPGAFEGVQKILIELGYLTDIKLE